MKTKGRRMSVNVEKAMTFGSKGPKQAGYMSTDPKYIQKMEAAAQDEMAKLGNAPRTKQQKENMVHNYLNVIHKAGRTPMPSPRGKTPPEPKSKRTLKPETEYPGTHTSNAMTRKWVKAIENKGKNSQPQTFESRKSPPKQTKSGEKDPIADIIKKSGGKQGRLKRK